MTQTSLELVEDGELNMLDLLLVIAKNLRLLVLGPLVAGLLALGATFIITPTFTATTKFMPPQQQQSGAAAMLSSLGALGGLAGAASGLKNPADQYVAFLKSRSLRDALIDRLKLTERYDTQLRQDVHVAMSSNVQVTSSKDGLITIDATDKDPVFAAQLANAHVEELGKLLNRLAVTEAQQRRMFFEKQLNNAKNNLVAAEQALRGSGVNSSALKASPTAAVEGLAKLKAAIAVQEVKLASMRGYLSEAAPDFKQAQIQLSAMRDQMARTESAEPAGHVGESDYIAKFRDFKYQETLFELFARQYEIARVDESREGAIIQVLDVAQPPERKSKPKRILSFIVIAVGAEFLIILFLIFGEILRRASMDKNTAKKFILIKEAFKNR